MSDTDEQRAILASEQFWLGGQAGAPKVYESGANFSAHVLLRGGSDNADASLSATKSARRMRFHAGPDGWSLTVDEA